MTAVSLDEELKNILDRIVSGYKPQKVILFGSAVRGDMHKDSDIDLFIIKDDPDKIIAKVEPPQKIEEVAPVAKEAVVGEEAAQVPSEGEEAATQVGETQESQGGEEKAPPA